MAEDVNSLVKNEFFELVPFNVAVIDRDYNILTANKNFYDYFGEWKKKKCFQAYKKQDMPCADCKVMDVFKNGVVRVSDESGIDRNGRRCHYVVHLAPVKDESGEVKYIIEMSTDITDTTRYQREYNIIFERVPNYVTIIDKDFKIIRANEKFRQTFGDMAGKHCFEVYKKKKKQCNHCPAALTFKDGKDHMATQTGVSMNGDETHYVINTTPLSRTGEGVSHVIEIATDITEVTKLEEQLKQSHDFQSTLIRNSADAIIGINRDGKTQIFNPAARELFDWNSRKKPGMGTIREMLPKEFFDNCKDGETCSYPETKVTTANGKEVPVRFHGHNLSSKKRNIGKVAFIEDLTQIKKLEREKLDAERLGAVGQTVAGLAHTIKNLLMGLEGGMYMVDTGLRNNNVDRLLNGWSVLQRNFGKITTLVKDFLSFSKGRLPEMMIINPNTQVENIVEFYKDAAKQQNVELVAEIDPNMKEAPLDPKGLEACLTNLISNGIDAATLNQREQGKVIVRTRSEGDTIVIEVEDNGTGMDDEVREKVFTTFFTTKGGKGTGLGLLTTRKIVQEHGGRIDVETIVGKGSIFRIRFPRERLKMILEDTRKK
jgi:PAS domain S-box-containing protein